MSSLSRYEVLGPIGDNHYARFFRGYDTVGERDVCIIEFLEKFRRNEERWQQIWQQILQAGRIKHDYLVSVYDYDRERGWVITELMQGSLRELAPDSLQDPELVRTVLYRTLETLDYLHSQHLPHGDVRPANLLYDIAGQTKLSFSPGLVLGGQIPRREKDHAFLAPEMFDPSFGEVGPGVDLYGCGMSALCLLLGKDFSKKLIGVAVSDDVAWQRFHRDLNSHPSVRELLPNLPSDMEAVIQKLISKKVDQRFTSIAEARKLLVRPEVEVRIEVQNAKPAPPEKKRPPAVPPGMFMDTTPARPAVPGKPAPKPRPVRDWLNRKLKNPLVMGLVSAFIVAMAIFAIAIIGELKERAKPVAVSISSTPPGASIVVDDNKFEQLTNAEVTLKRGPHTLKLELSGYEPASQQFEIPPGQSAFEVPSVSLTPLVVEKPPEKPIEKPAEKPEEKPPVEEKPVPPVPAWQLPVGLEPLGEEVDPDTQLPRRVLVTRLKSELQESDAQLSFLLLPKGELTFGAADPLEQGELASQKVAIDAPFYISEFELTKAQYAPWLKTRSDNATQNPLPDELRNFPVVSISFADALEYCQWLGPEFDLPTEREWEWAAKGSENRKFPWGNDPPAQESVKMKIFAPIAGGIGTTVPVGQLEKGKTPLGVRHLLGNAAEWCKDLYTPGHNENAETTGAEKLHVIRGGSYRSPPSGPVRVTWRANAPDTGANDVGVRIVCHPLLNSEQQSSASPDKSQSE
ncbi:MAG: SUMF1/EgtB/PvdO family nonheme iron enzyme [Planctomycetaceae bacterium]|nr:SUMF1/EgtB/PvdO family nonheme iron enzyme [Planctomycetaceae bacterium]